MLTSSLDLDGVVAEVDFERDQILELREQLSGKRDYIGGAGGVVLSVLALRQQGGEGSLGNRPELAGYCSGLVYNQPGALRELHWHPNASEWQYYTSGSGRMTVFASEGQTRTMDYKRRLRSAGCRTLCREYWK